MSENTGLVARVESLATSALDDDALRDALDQATYALAVVVNDAESAEQAAQMTLALTKAQKHLAEKKKPFSATLRDAQNMLARIFGSPETRLADAKAYLDNQLKGYGLLQRREAERVEREAAEQRLAAEKAAREAAAAGAPPPPPRRVVHVDAPAPIRTAAGTVSTRWTLAFEMVNAREVPEDWLLLDGKQARAWGQTHAEAEGLVKKDGASIVHRGVRYWYEPDVHKSGR